MRRLRGLARAIVVAAALAAAVAGSACAQVEAPPSHATRIVSLVPAVTEMLFAIGAGDRVVGVSSYDHFPPEVESRARVGALVDPDFERILSLRPDLVIVYGTQMELVGRLRQAGIPMYRYEHAGLADITQTISAVGELAGRPEAAASLIGRIESDLDAIRRRVAGRGRPKTALIFGRELGTLRGIFASGGVGFLHDMLELAGGEDVFGDVRRQNLQATAETLLARAPEVIIEIHPGPRWPPERIEREQRAWLGLPSLPAVRSNRVYILVDDRFSIPGPRVAEAVQLLADVLHPAG
jgi:iron complex transport system substrate-binding protein